MANIEKDPITGQYTTGHEWDGVQELNTPLPRWWVYVFYASIVWSIGYWIVYPAWPTLSGYTKGIWNYSSRAELAQDLKAAETAKGAWLNKFKAASVEDIAKDKELLNYAMVGGRSAFNENCAPCHGAGGAGAFGYPTLADDEWIWGGTLTDIQQTITHGIRNADGDSRQGEMPKFGTDAILTAEQIGQVTDYVLSLSAAKHDAAGAAAGKTLFADNCASCHGEDGSGTQAVGAPALNNAVWLYKAADQKAAVARQIAAPKHGSMPAWTGRLDETTIKQLTVYVHSLGGGK